MENVTNYRRNLLIKAETLFNFGSYGHFPFPESSLPGSKWNTDSYKRNKAKMYVIIFTEVICSLCMR